MTPVDRLWHRLRKPLCWQLTTRRIFLLLLPAALPLWLAALSALVVLKAFGAVFAPLVMLWSAPPRHSVGYHNYGSRGGRGRNPAPDLIYMVRRG